MDELIGVSDHKEDFISILRISSAKRHQLFYLFRQVWEIFYLAWETLYS